MKTVAQIRAEVDIAKVIAMRNFKRDWGTDDVSVVMGALRQTIPSSGNPRDAAIEARNLLK